MSITVQDICQTLEAFAPLNLQESYDNAGLLVGELDTPVRAVLVCLDVTESVMEEAVAKGCNMVVSHHPLIFKGVKAITGPDRITRCLIKAIQHNIALYACHTNADSVFDGVNGRMAEMLHLQDCRILASKPGETHVGLGMLGRLNTPMPVESFLQEVKRVFNVHTLRHSGYEVNSVIRTVALCGGSGSEFYADAKRAGADVFITADVKFHEFFTQGSPVLLVDAGHFETEQFTKALFVELLSKKFPTFAVHISTAETNPVHYF